MFYLIAENYYLRDVIAGVASLVIGMCLGLIGAGGSILTIPVFVYILHKDAATSGIYSMFVVGICSLAGSIKSIINKLVDFEVTVLLGIPSIAGVLIARKLIFPSIPVELFVINSFVLTKEVLLMLCLAVLMFVTGVRMLNTASNTNLNGSAGGKLKTGFLLVQGLLVGIITGLLGIGGGFLIVPALYFWARLPIKKAIGTTLLIITINSVVSFLTSYTSRPCYH